jgi:hypothetical protein
MSVTSRIALISRATTPLAFIACAAVILLRFPPTRYTFYPQCPVYDLFHLQCPGCGATRALAALLRGHFTEALHLNALFTLMLPPAMLYATICYRRYLRREPLCWPQIPPAGIYAWLAVAAIFSVLRNLPVGLL